MIKMFEHENLERELQIVGVKSIYFPHQLIGVDRKDWISFLALCDNYEFNNYLLRWEKRVAEELIVSYWKWNTNILKIMSTLFNGELIGIMFVNEEPTITVQDYNIILMNADLNLSPLCFHFSHLLEIIYSMVPPVSKLSTEFNKLLNNDRIISLSPYDLHTSKQNFTVKSRKYIQNISDISGDALTYWNLFLDKNGPILIEDDLLELVFVEWLWTDHQFKSIIIDIYAWPYDDHYGAIFMDNKMVFQISDKILTPQPNLIGPKFKQLIGLEPIFSRIRLSYLKHINL